MPSFKPLLPAIFTYRAFVGFLLLDRMQDVMQYLTWSDGFGRLTQASCLGLSIDLHSDLLSEHFMPEVFLLSQSTIWATKEKQHLQSSMVK